MIWISFWFRRPFLGFRSISLIFLSFLLKCCVCMTFLDFRLKCLDQNQLMTQAASRRLESIQLMTKEAFQELARNHLMTQVDSPGIDSDWLMTQGGSPLFDSNQLTTQVKNICFWVDSWFDSESYPCLVPTIFNGTINWSQPASAVACPQTGAMSLFERERKNGCNIMFLRAGQPSSAESPTGVEKES